MSRKKRRDLSSSLALFGFERNLHKPLQVVTCGITTFRSTKIDGLITSGDSYIVIEKEEALKQFSNFVYW